MEVAIYSFFFSFSGFISSLSGLGRENGLRTGREGGGRRGGKERNGRITINVVREEEVDDGHALNMDPPHACCGADPDLGLAK